MNNVELQTKKFNIFSQNGEDGIIEELFKRIGISSKTCCEFGAWDGIHLSNCRKLIQEGWTCIMLEGESNRFKKLVANYRDNPNVICLNNYVDTNANSLDSLLSDKGITTLDFLSIDIDGLDYELFADLKLRPRVLCIEVNAGHHPADASCIPPEIAQYTVGQPLLRFSQLAANKCYRLVCYTGNAFFARSDIVAAFDLPTPTPKEAYEDFLSNLERGPKEWMYLVNLGLTPPFYMYNYRNSYLTRQSLQISSYRAAFLRLSIRLRRIARICCGLPNRLRFKDRRFS